MFPRSSWHALKRATGQSQRLWQSPKRDTSRLNRDDTGHFSQRLRPIMASRLLLKSNRVAKKRSEIFDTDFDKYTEDAVALFSSLGVSTTFENLEGFPMDSKTNAPAFVRFMREHQCPSFSRIR